MDDQFISDFENELESMLQKLNNIKLELHNYITSLDDELINIEQDRLQRKTARCKNIEQDRLQRKTATRKNILRHTKVRRLI